MHVHTLTRTHTLKHKHKHNTHTCMHTDTQINTHTPTHTHIYTYTNIHTCQHTRTRAHTYILVHKNVQIDKISTCATDCFPNPPSSKNAPVKSSVSPLLKPIAIYRKQTLSVLIKMSFIIIIMIIDVIYYY